MLTAHHADCTLTAHHADCTPCSAGQGNESDPAESNFKQTLQSLPGLSGCAVADGIYLSLCLPLITDEKYAQSHPLALTIFGSVSVLSRYLWTTICFSLSAVHQSLCVLL